MRNKKYFSPEKTAIVCHFDGHGVAAGVLLSELFDVPRTNIISKFPETGPNGFAGIPEIFSFYQYNHIYIVDIAVDVKNPYKWMSTLHTIFHQARTMSRVYMFYIDHHETSIPFLKNFPAFMNIYFMPSSYHLDLLVSKEPNKDLVFIGAICDRDPTVLKYIPQEKYKELYEAALGLDVLVRKNIEDAIRYADNTDKLRIYADEIPSVNDFGLFDNVVLVNEQLPSAWAFKVLEKVATENDVPYAVGYALSNQTNQFVAIAIRRWDIELRTIQELIGNNPFGRQSYGHPNARTIAATSENDAKNIAQQIAQQIENKTKTLNKIKQIIEDPELNAALQAFLNKT
ncbi:MAG: hypothetical protein Q6363_007970 [Candidatus Njordarchaeota archaeon]